MFALMNYSKTYLPKLSASKDCLVNMHNLHVFKRIYSNIERTSLPIEALLASILDAIELHMLLTNFMYYKINFCSKHMTD